MKKAYYTSFYSQTREMLIGKCFDVLKKGQKIIYILPSREAMFDVRNQFLESYGGIVNSSIYGFDDLEREICQKQILSQRFINNYAFKVIVRDILTKNKNQSIFDQVKSKPGFISGVCQFIKRLKRLNISPEQFKDKLNLIESILNKKCSFLSDIYQEYEDFKKKEGLYDINDISLLACGAVKQSQLFSSVGVIVIDGFINIDPVHKLLLKNLSQAYPSIDLYANIPYKNRHNQTFLENEILKDLKELGFVLSDSVGQDSDTIQPSIKLLAENLYSSQKVLVGDIEGISILNSPCIDHEVRQAARLIKERILKGETIAHKIAIYVQNLDQYQETIRDVFQEMGIPIQLRSSERLLSIPFIKELLSLFKDNVEFSAFLESQDLRKNIIARHQEGILEAKSYLRDLKALEALENILDELFELSRDYPSYYQGDMGLYLDLIERLSETETGINILDNGGVRILNPDLARGQFYHLVFILGANEGVSPGISRANPLFDLTEDHKLFQQGINLPNNRWEIEREKIRFNLCLAFTSKEVVFSYLTSDEEGGYLIKSPFIDEVESLMDQEALKKVTAPVFYMRDRFFPQEMEPGYLHHSAKVELGRIKNPHFDNYDGLLANPKLAQQDAQYGFSPSQLNNYFSCPFKYYSERVLDLSDLDEEGGGAKKLGIFYHGILYRYYHQNDKWYNYDEEKLKQIFKCQIEILNEESLPSKVLQFLKKEQWQIISTFLQQDTANLEYYYQQTGLRLKPIMLEQPFAINYSSNLIRGRIDRVDLEIDESGEYTGKFIIYDYKKSNGKTLKECVEMKDFQLPIYYLAIVDYLKKKFVLKNPKCLALLYYSIESKAKSGIVRKEIKKHLFQGRSGPRDLVGENNLKILVEWIIARGGEVIEEIRKGKFTLPHTCIFESSTFKCKYSPICRYDKYRVAIKEKAGEKNA